MALAPRRMARPRVYKTEGIVVRQSPMGEADRVLTLLSPERGQIRAVAKGVRRARGRLTGHLELLNRVHVSISKGRNLDIVVEAQCLDGLPALRNDLGRVAAGMYVAELADAFSVPQDDDHRDSDVRKVYELVTEALSRLAIETSPAEGNFVLGDFGARSDFVFNGLNALDVRVRRFPHRPEIRNALRITVPDQTEPLERLLDALQTCLAPDGLLFDLGLSSRQLDAEERGFSFRRSAGVTNDE